MNELVELSSTSELRINTDGVWYYGETPLERIGLIQLFYSVLNKQSDGYYITTPIENVRVQVDDAPYSVVNVLNDTEDSINLLLNDESQIPLDAAHPLHMSERGILYVHVRFDRNGALLEARFTWGAYIKLASMLVATGDGRFLLRSYGHAFVLE